MAYEDAALNSHVDIIESYYFSGSMSRRLAEVLLEMMEEEDNDIFVRAYATQRMDDIEEALENSAPSVRERWDLRSELLELENDRRNIYPSARKVADRLHREGLLNELLTLIGVYYYEEGDWEEDVKDLLDIFYNMDMPELRLGSRLVFLVRLNEIEEDLLDDLSAKERVKLLRDKIELEALLKEVS